MHLWFQEAHAGLDWEAAATGGVTPVCIVYLPFLPQPLSGLALRVPPWKQKCVGQVPPGGDKASLEKNKQIMLVHSELGIQQATGTLHPGGH